MNKTIARMIGAAALAAAGCAAHAEAITSTTSAQIQLAGWTHGAGYGVQATGYSGLAGGLSGRLVGAGAFDSEAFATYSIELEERYGFSRMLVSGYAVVDGATYFQNRHGSADIADKIGRLMTFVADNPSLVDDAARSTGLQLAIWDLIYDIDYSVTAAGSFRALGAFNSGADFLLAGAQGVAASRYDVFALERAGSQDLLLVSLRGSGGPGTTDNGVPEPGSMALVAAALAGLAAARLRA